MKFLLILGNITILVLISVAKKILGSQCDLSDICMDINALCEKGICSCIPTFYQDTPTTCSKFENYHILS